MNKEQSNYNKALRSYGLKFASFRRARAYARSRKLSDSDYRSSRGRLRVASRRLDAAYEILCTAAIQLMKPQGPTLSGIQDASDTVASTGSEMPKLALTENSPVSALIEAHSNDPLALGATTMEFVLLAEHFEKALRRIEQECNLNIPLIPVIRKFARDALQGKTGQ